MKAGKKRGRTTAAGRPREGPLTVFVHIPKTAGTTFAAVLRDNFPEGVRNIGNVFKGSGGFDPGPSRRLRDAPVLRTRDIHVLTGHLPFGIRDRLPKDARYITFLRDPVERTLSQYYGLGKPNRRRPLPGDGSLEAVLADGELIYDNLQTRMLSDVDEPTGEVDDAMLAQAKENLQSGFTAFGLVERFDESLVLFRRLLGLRSIVYVRQRVASRPRGAEVPEEALRMAEHFNRYDVELYRWAREAFGQAVDSADADFAADVAALQGARDGDVSHVPEAPGAVDRDTLWELLVRTRTELLTDRRDRARAEVAGRDDMPALLEELNEKLAELSDLDVAARAGKSAEGAEAPRRARRRGGRGKRRDNLPSRAAQLAQSLEEASARLESTQGRLRELEGLDDPTSLLESERLRKEEENLQQRVDRLSTRSTKIRQRLGAMPAGDAGGDATPG